MAAAPSLSWRWMARSAGLGDVGDAAARIDVFQIDEEGAIARRRRDKRVTTGRYLRGWSSGAEGIGQQLGIWALRSGSKRVHRCPLASAGVTLLPTSDHHVFVCTAVNQIASGRCRSADR